MVQCTGYNKAYNTVYSIVWKLELWSKSAKPATSIYGYSHLFRSVHITVYSTVYSTVYNVVFGTVYIFGSARHS